MVNITRLLNIQKIEQKSLLPKKSVKNCHQPFKFLKKLLLKDATASSIVSPKTGNIDIEALGYIVLPFSIHNVLDIFHFFVSVF